LSEPDKCMSMAEAISRFVKPGCHLSIGGFTLNRNPMAAVYEIIRQRIDNLHLYAHSNGQGVDELIGAGCVRAIEIAYGGNGRFAPTCIRFRKAIETGQIHFEDYSNYQMTLRFMAGAMGVPFLPTTSGLGTDILQKWGFSPEFREAETRLPREKLLVMDNPFRRQDEDPPKVVLLPAVNPDVTIIHPQFLKMYQRLAKDDALYASYLGEYVYGVDNHQQLCDLVGREQLQRIRAVNPQGYAAGLDRR